MTKGFTTKAVHNDRLINSPEQGAVHTAISASVLFGYEKVEELVDVFQGRKDAHAYGRQSTPSIYALQDMITEMEDGVGTLTFATGMAAITTCMLTLLKAGDHVIISQFVFGNTSSFIETLGNLGVSVTQVDVTLADNVSAAVQENTRLVFTETIANPVTQVADLVAIGEICKQHGLIYMVDNTMTPSYIYSAKACGASLVVCSLTKYFAGHGHVLGGSVTDLGQFDWVNYPNINAAYRNQPAEKQGLTQIKKKGLRDLGGCLSSHSAHLLAVGAETLGLRMDKCANNALKLAKYLQQHPKVATVYYPGLDEHPQHYRASGLFKNYGGIMSLDLLDGVDCFAFMNKLGLIVSSTHLGDTRTLAIPVAQTIYYEMGAELRRKSAISDNMIRFSIGIEDIDDLIADFEQALA